MLESVQTLEGHTDRVWTLAWNPTGTTLASSGADKIIRLWAKDSKSDKWVCASKLTETHSKSIRRLCWSPCGNYLASASFDATVCIWKRNAEDNSWSTLVNLEGHESEVKSVAWSHDGNFLASCGRDRTIWIWEKAVSDDLEEVSDDPDGYLDSAANWDCSDVKNDHTKDVKHIVWHPHHNILVSCSYDDTVKFFHKDGDDWVCQETLTAHTSTVWSADFSPCGTFLATSSDDKTVRVWKNHACDKLPQIHSNSWKCVSVIQGFQTRSIYDVSWCKINNVFASASGDNSLAICSRSPQESQDGDIFTCVEKMKDTHDCDVNSVSWNPKLPGLLASGSDDRKIKLWLYSHNDEKGMRPLKVVDELMNSLSKASLQSNITTHSINPTDNENINQANEVGVFNLSIDGFSSLMNFTKTLQELQAELWPEDDDRHALENLFDLKISQTMAAKKLNISSLDLNELDRCVKSFQIDIIDKSGKVVHEFRLLFENNSGFNLKMPRRSIKLVRVADELFILEKTGDLFKVLPSGENEFLLGHLFTFSDVQFLTDSNGYNIRYILSADRDEKIRVSRYPETYEIEAYCFGHKHLLRQIILVNENKFVSIDQQNEVCVWNLMSSVSMLSSGKLIPEITSTLDGSSKKRLCVR